MFHEISTQRRSRGSFEFELLIRLSTSKHTVILVDDLEVFDGSLRNATVEVEHERLRLCDLKLRFWREEEELTFTPDRRFVLHLDDVIGPARLVALDERVALLQITVFGSLWDPALFERTTTGRILCGLHESESSMPGMTMVILRGPRKPRTFGSCDDCQSYGSLR